MTPSDMEISVDIWPDCIKKTGLSEIVLALEAKAGHGCVRLVGGCVRDLLAGRPVGDVDLATTIKPDQVEAILIGAGIKVLPTGLAHGTLTAIRDGKAFEITTLRQDIETDGRHAHVQYTESWEEDAARRDLTLNALYMDFEGRIFDPTGQGLADLKARRVRFIGHAESRIEEDYLRLLRFFRFSGDFAEVFDPDGLAACGKHLGGLSWLSGERLWSELRKIAALPRAPWVMSHMAQYGVMGAICIELEKSDLSVFNGVCALSKDGFLRILSLLCDGGNIDETKLDGLAHRLRWSNADLARGRMIGQALHDPRGLDPDNWLGLAYDYSVASVRDACILIAGAKGMDRHVLESQLHVLQSLDIPVFPLKGADMLKRGFAQGPEIRKQLKTLEALWIASGFDSAALSPYLEGDSINTDPT